MKILHIANWYPNKYNPLECLFIKEHIDSLQDEGVHELWHVQVRNEGGLFRLETGNYSDHEHYLILNTSIKSWFVNERLHLLLLYILKRKLGTKRYDAVNFHIAYPLLRFTKTIQKLFGIPLIITEHWSAYRSGFGLNKGSKARSRIEQIFKHNIPVITVSKALLNDIITFSGINDFPHYIVPNIVNTEIFFPVNSKQDNIIKFLMVANWAPIKKPFLVLEALASLSSSFTNFQLDIIGYGEQWDAMQQFVIDNQLERFINFQGRKTKDEIAAFLQETSVFLHPSEYETFSVVCAEALCCGIPVIASKVGGIMEVVPAQAGLLVKNTSDAWEKGLRRVLSEGYLSNIDKKVTAQEASKKYSKPAVGNRYFAALKEITSI